MCQNIDDAEALINEAMNLLMKAKKQIKEKESKIKKKKVCLEHKEETNKTAEVDTYNNIYNIINHYQKYHPLSMRGVKKNSGIIKKIKARLDEGYKAEEICRAIDGQHISPFHLGENKTKTTYLQLELVVRSGQKIDQFLEIFDRPKTSTLKPKTARTLNAAQDWLSDDEDLQPVQDNQRSVSVPLQPLSKGWAAK
jgi:hypothetical protein